MEIMRKVDDLAKHEAWFKLYTERFIKDMTAADTNADTGPLYLKVEHTGQVLENAKNIVVSKEFLEQMSEAKKASEKTLGVSHDGEIIYACHVAALYHDIGRFPQYRDYGTFADALSVNHAKLSAQTLVREGILKMESAFVRRMVVGAVAMHNRYALPKGINEVLKLVTDVVRDADKLDIVRIMAPQLSCACLEEARQKAKQSACNKDGGHNVVTMHVKDEPEKWSEAVVKDALAGRVARYTDMRYVNDFRIVIGTWVKELRFNASCEHLAKTGHIHKILEALPHNSLMEDLTAYLLQPLS